SRTANRLRCPYIRIAKDVARVVGSNAPRPKPGVGAVGAEEVRRASGGDSVVSTRGRNPLSARPIRHIRVAVTCLKPESSELRRHPIESNRAVPGLVYAPGIRLEVRRSRDGVRPVNRRKQCQVAALFIQNATTERYTEQILVELKA